MGEDDTGCEHGRCVRDWTVRIELRDGTVYRMCQPHADLILMNTPAADLEGTSGRWG